MIDNSGREALRPFETADPWTVAGDACFAIVCALELLPLDDMNYEVREAVEDAIEMARAGWADEAAKHEGRTRGGDACLT